MSNRESDYINANQKSMLGFIWPWITIAILFALLVVACGRFVIEKDVDLRIGDTQSTPLPSPTPNESSITAIALPSIADLVRSVAPAVVSIQVSGSQMTLFGSIESVGSGSGFIFRKDGYIITNNHVVEDATNISVALYDGKELEADLIGSDPRTDLAVIKVDQDELPTVELGDVSKLLVGDWVVAIGNALGLQGGPSVTLGVISALGRTLPVERGVTLYDLIQTDAAINPGNSGGPLINLSGEVVGINTMVIRDVVTEGIGFAVSAETAILVADKLIENGRVPWPYLGITGSDVNLAVATQMNLAVREGILIEQVESGGPAGRAGLQSEDVIVAIEGHSTPDFRVLQRLLQRQFRVGQLVVVTVVRGADSKDFALTLGEFPR